MQTLIYMCHKKNELNRRRRRFYYIWSFLAGHHYQANESKKRELIGFTVKSAWKGYKKAQTEMKAMTKEMRTMRIECGARFIWNDGGLITHLELGDGRRIPQTSFKKFYEAEVFENELFKEEKV